MTIIRFIRRYIFLLLVFIAAIFAFTGQALLPGRVLLPTDIIVYTWAPWRQDRLPAEVHNMAGSDVVNYIYPVKTFAAEQIRAGKLPLWNPYGLLGYDFTYNTQAGLFYPFSLFYYLLPGPTAVDLTIWGQMLLGCLFMFAYLRLIGLKVIAAVCGALVFVFNGFMMAWLEWQVVQAAVIWLPAQLFLAERLRQVLVGKDKSPIPTAVLLSIAFAIPWLGGHWNWTLYTSMTLGVYLIWRVVLLSSAYRPDWRGLCWTIFSLGLGTLLCLVQLWPAYVYLSQSHRQALPFWQLLTQGSYRQAILWLMPKFFGDSLAQNWWAGGSPVLTIVETAVYPGLFALTLAVFAIWRRRDVHTRFFAAWGILSLLWAWGTPLYSLLYILPVFDGLQPNRAGFLPVFCTSVLAALGLDYWLRQRPSAKDTRLLGMIFLLWVVVVAGYTAVWWQEVWEHRDFLRTAYAIFALFGLGWILLIALWGREKLPPRWLGGVVVACIMFDLWLAWHDFNTVGTVAQLYPVTETDLYLQAEERASPSRMVTMAQGIAYHPNTSFVTHITSLNGYEPGLPTRLVNLVHLIEGEDTGWFGRVLALRGGVNSPLLDMLNVKHVVTTEEWWADESFPDPQAQQTAVSNWRPLPQEQTFLMQNGGLQRVDLPLRVADEVEGDIIVRVLSADGLYEFANARLPAAEVDSESWHSFFFAPFPSDWGREFRWQVSLDGTGDVAAGSDENGLMAYAAYYLPRPHLVHEAGKTRIYLNEGYFPRAYAVQQAQLVANEAEVLALLAADTERLNEIVFLELEGKPPPPNLGQVTKTMTNSVRFDLSEPNEVMLTVELSADSILVLADGYDAGWRAAVDGEPTAIYRANSVMRAIHVPAGTHSVRFVFWPQPFIIGGLISGFALLSCLILLVWNQRGNRIVRRVEVTLNDQTTYNTYF